MNKLFFLLSLFLLSVSTVKSQVYKFHVSHLESYHYPNTMSFSESQKNHMLVQDGAYSADFDVTINLTKKTLTVQEPNKPEVVVPIIEVYNEPNMILTFMVNDHFVDGNPVTSLVTINRVDNSENFYYMVENMQDGKIYGMIDFEIKKIEVSK